MLRPRPSSSARDTASGAMAVAGSAWTVLWVACFAVAPRPVAALLRGPSASSGTSSGTLSGTAAADAQARLSVVDWNSYDEREQDGPGTYSFGYEIEDAASANTQFRQEERFANGTVAGSYGLVEPDGNVRVVNYVADARGYRVRIENSLRKNENFPRASPAPPRRPTLKRPADRLLDSEVDAVPAASPSPPSPLTWALVALQGGRRPPLQEQRLRPASAAATAAKRRRGQQRRQMLQPEEGEVEEVIRMGEQQQQQQQQREMGRREEHSSRRLQQQRQWRDGQDWYQSQGYLPGDTVLRYAQQGRGQDDDAVLSNHLAPSSSSADSTSGRQGWTSAPIVVWPAAAAAAGPNAPRYVLPPIPSLDKLIYKRNVS